MKKILFLLFIFSTNAFALEAVVVVLEAPMFKEKDYDSPVVQYLRKGDVFKIHPSVGNDTQFDHLAPTPEKYQEMKKKLAAMPEWKDPLFDGKKDNTAYLEDEFIPTLDRQGNTVYVLSEHIYVYFNDSREYTQAVNKKDLTDYRLEEPLPKSYPLVDPAGYRGIILLGFSQPYNESYDYPDTIKTKGYTSPVEFNFGLLWQVDYNKSDRFYYGMNFHLKTFENEYTFPDRRSSKESYMKLGIGPLISYDAYKGEKNRLNVSVSINLNPYNRLEIVQKDNDILDTRDYRSFNFSSRLGLQYHRKKIVNDLDFVLGTSFDIESPATYKAISGGRQTAWWDNLGEDKFTTRPTFSLTAFMGIQVAY